MKCYYIKNVRVKKKKTLRSYDVAPHEYQLKLASDALIVDIKGPCPEIPYHVNHFASSYNTRTLLNKTEILKCLFHTKLIFYINIT